MTETLAAISNIEAFYANLGLPESCFLGKKLFKKHFYEHGQLNATDKKAFVEDVDHIEWRYTLKPATINIPRYVDETYDYTEVAVIHVALLEGKRHSRIADVIQKAIPYPLLIVFTLYQDDADQLSLSVADKRINRSDSEKLVVESTQDSGWINLASHTPWELAFLNDFKARAFSYQDLRAFYYDIVERIVGLNCAKHTGQYESAEQNRTPTVDRLEALRQLDQLDSERSELRNKLKKEKNMGTQVQLNTRVKQISDRIEAIKQTL
ncbi:MAG: DUF4391 domain-containing protein [Candidatus Thiodiazotropha endolucinida]|nr:DUF4391 domain-containing protein [Candidatus Thiodiazotropha taylori]MCW4262552.1 DUF4391 domain-containing protein [Candidatus Thiodiazotropha endolucinida]